MKTIIEVKNIFFITMDAKVQFLQRIDEATDVDALSKGMYIWKYIIQNNIIKGTY